MNPAPRQRRTRKGDVIARVLLVVGLAAAVGLVLAGGGSGAHEQVAACTAPANAEPLALL